MEGKILKPLRRMAIIICYYQQNKKDSRKKIVLEYFS